MKERFLPIGTVVLLKNGKKEVKPEKKIYEYGACIYPEGILDSNTVCAFNHDQIEKICHLGYETETQKELSDILNKGYEIYKSKYETPTE